MKTSSQSSLALTGGRNNLNSLRSATPPAGPVTPVDRFLLRLFKTAIGRPPLTFTLWDDDRPKPSQTGRAVGRITFLTRMALWQTCLHPELGFGDRYAAGEIRIDGDLVRVLQAGFAAMDRSPFTQFKRRFLTRLPPPHGNSQGESRRNIAWHYDLGNDFYRLWLDPEMVYTCAYYRAADMDLAQAQLAKLDHVCRKAGLAPGMQVVEAGCGWGSLALHMARCFGVRVRAFNISREQIEFARQRARSEGLDHAVEFIEDDYRNIHGRFDAFLSVGMLEHVGKVHYQDLGDVIRRSLSPCGRGLIHSVGRNQASPMNGWIGRRIFPGSQTPSLAEMMGIFEKNELSVIDVENLRLHYARTLIDWLRRFEQHEHEVTQMYDERFVRGWRLYLGGCAAAFLAGNLQLFQVVFAPARCNHLPLSRDHLYRPESPAYWEA